MRREARHLPRQPGVYTFTDENGDPLYIGKAASLRARVMSYFSADHPPRLAKMLSEAHHVESVLVDSEQEAYLLESSLIKARQPKYNVRLTDDKRYPWILVSDEAHPRIDIVRDQREPGDYYGPFPDVSSAKELVNILREVFGIRDCPRELPEGCIKHDIGLCMAPCFKQIDEAYDEAVAEVTRVLRGNPKPAIEVLEDRMAEASQDLEFERAARLRDRIQGIRRLFDKQAVFASHREDVDAIAMEGTPERSVAVVLPRRDGRIVDTQHFRLPGATEEDKPQLLAEFIARYYEHRPAVPHTLAIPFQPQQPDELSEALAAKAGHKVELRVPQRGKHKRLLDLAAKNAGYQLARAHRSRGPAPGVVDLQERLRLETPPSRIECIDISHHSGKGVVGALVTFKDGRAHKQGYRRYKISQEKNDDVAAIREVVTRRLRRLVEEGEPLPDLLLIDGGQAQTNAAREAARELGLEEVEILGIAKREEELWRPGWQAPIRLPENAPGLQLLQRARDEAHRFAITYGRKKRTRDLTTSLLDAVPGVGEVTRKRLLRHFGSLDGVRKATQAELTEVEGVGPKMAQKIKTVVGQEG